MIAAEQSSATARVTIRGQIARLFFSGPGFSAGLLRTDDGEIRFAGPFALRENDFVVFIGHYEKHATYGLQLKVDKYEPDMKLDADGLIRFLALSKPFKGIGIIRARELVARFGDNFDHVVMNEPERLVEIKGVTLEVAKGLREEWASRRDHGKTIAFLSGFGLTPYQVDRIMEELGNSAYAVVQDNPYVLIEKLDGFGFRRVDDIALKTGVVRADPKRLRAGVLYALQKASEGGHTCLPMADFRNEAIELLTLDSDDAYELLNSAVRGLAANGDIVEFDGDGDRGFLALASLHRMETFLARVFDKHGRVHAA
jgi:exodeoxyribonuclease V alpha subunit